MKKIHKTKLNLNAETLVALSSLALDGVHGGVALDPNVGIGTRTCPTRCSMCPACPR